MEAEQTPQVTETKPITCSLTVAQRTLGYLVDRVHYRGATVVLTKNGKPWAKIVPMEERHGERPSTD